MDFDDSISEYDEPCELIQAFSRLKLADKHFQLNQNCQIQDDDLHSENSVYWVNKKGDDYDDEDTPTHRLKGINCSPLLDDLLSRRPLPSRRYSFTAADPELYRGSRWSSFVFNDDTSVPFSRQPISFITWKVLEYNQRFYKQANPHPETQTTAAAAIDDLSIVTDDPSIVTADPTIVIDVPTISPTVPDSPASVNHDISPEEQEEVVIQVSKRSKRRKARNQAINEANMEIIIAKRKAQYKAKQEKLKKRQKLKHQNITHTP